MKKLADPQQAIYDFILAHCEQFAYPPTVREICKAVGLSSTATVHAHLNRLEQRGLLSRDPTKQRSIVLTGHQGNGQSVPLVGNIAAGGSFLADDNIEDELLLPPALLHGGQKHELFVMRFEGNSMIAAGIFNGDYVVVHNGLKHANGDIVLVRIHGERATVKRIYTEKQQVRLQPENVSMQPIYVSRGDVEVVGKVVGLMRAY